MIESKACSQILDMFRFRFLVSTNSEGFMVISTMIFGCFLRELT